MTDPPSDSDHCMVRVRAQVMTRDDDSGCWIPLSGGGLSNVSVIRKKINFYQLNGIDNLSTSSPSSAPSTVDLTSNSSQSRRSLCTPPPVASLRNYEYHIYGKRIKDEAEVLNCTMKDDFEYHKVMPTFHHWVTGEKKFGLTFQTAADARAFDRGVRLAYVELGGRTEKTTMTDSEGGDEGEVFMALNLPANPPPPPPPPHEVTADNYLYLTTFKQEYLYPVIEPQHQQNDKPTDRKDSNKGTIKKSDIVLIKATRQPTPPMPTLAQRYPNAKMEGSLHISTTLNGDVLYRCKHCLAWFSEESNRRGICKKSPDMVKKGIYEITCMPCAQCVVYHCFGDPDDSEENDPYSCPTTEDNCGKRWLSLSLLSCFAPCLCFYPPLRFLHWIGSLCGICGGRHERTE